VRELQKSDLAEGSRRSFQKYRRLKYDGKNGARVSEENKVVVVVVVVVGG